MMSCDNTVMPNLTLQSDPALPGTGLCPSLGLQHMGRILPAGKFTQEQQEDAGYDQLEEDANVMISWANISSLCSRETTLQSFFKALTWLRNIPTWLEYSNHFPILTKLVQFFPGVPQSCTMIL